MLFNLTVVSYDGALALSYYFTDCALAQQDAWELSIAEGTRDLWPHVVKGDDLCCVCDRRVVVCRGRSDVVFILSGDDELELACQLDPIVALLSAVCDNRLSFKLISEFHGKAVVCISDMFPSGGVQAYSDVEIVLRNAKLKAPQV